MKIFKYLFFLILIVIIGGSIYIATLNGNYQLEKSVVIPAPQKMVFNEVNNYKNWENWDPWLKRDAHSDVTYSEKTSGEGASFAWKGDLPKGHMVTKKVTPYSSVKQQRITEHTFGQADRNFYWHFEPQDHGTKVTWGVKGEQRFMEKAFQISKDSSLAQRMAPFLEEGLTRLKEDILKKMEVFKIKVDGVTQYGGGYYMYSTTASKKNPNALTAKISKIIPDVKNYMEDNDIQKDGAAVAVYNKIDDRNGSVIVSAGIPTPSQVVTPSDSSILCGFIESQKVVKVTLKGNSTNLPKAWEAARAYMTKNELEEVPDSTPIEVFVTDPEEVVNPAEWITELYLPVQETKDSADNTAANLE